MQVFRVLATQFDVLDDLDQNFVTALLKDSGVAQVVFHFRRGGRPLDTFRRILGFFYRKSRLDCADNGNFSTNHPTHDASRFLADAFDAGHQIREITKLAKEFTGAFHRGS